MFVQIQSQGADQTSAPLPSQQRRPSLSSPLQRSVNTDARDPRNARPESPERLEEDSQATQIEEFREPPAVDSSDPTNQSSAVPSASQTASGSKASRSAESPQQERECSRTQLSNQNSDAHKKAESPLKEPNVKDVQSSNSCVPETPSDIAALGLSSRPGAPRTSGGAASSEGLRGGPAKRQPEGHEQDAASAGPTLKDGRDKCEQGDVEEEEGMEEESTGGASGVALVLSQSQLLSPEPMDEEDSQDTNQGSEKDVTPQTEASHAQPVRGKPPVSANGLGCQTEEKEVTPGGLSHVDNVDKDKSLSESSGGKHTACTVCRARLLNWFSPFGARSAVTSVRELRGKSLHPG